MTLAGLIAVVGLLAGLGLIAIRVPIAFALGIVSTFCILAFFSISPDGSVNLAFGLRPALTMMSNNIFSFFTSFDLISVPMFIALGHLCLHSGITRDIYEAGRVWLTRVPGGLAMASVLGCGGFAAISGSSVACAATMGTVAVPEMTRSGYDERLATGSVAAGGTLGALIPPSILFIVYAVFTEQSISKLFIAGLIPGLVTMVGYFVTIAVWTALRPEAAPRTDVRYSTREKIAALVSAWPAVVIFAIILVGIYGGFFTATEAASVSFLTALLMSVGLRRITARQIVQSLYETALQTAAIFLIAAAAKNFGTYVSLTGIAASLTDAVMASNPSPLVILLCVILVYLVLGMVLDPIGILLITLPFFIPLMEMQGYNLIWFGVIVVKLLEMGLLTPPMGMNAFIISSVTRIPSGRVFLGVVPFFAMDLLVVAALVAVPGLSLLLV